jgi:hypothetical protein
MYDSLDDVIDFPEIGATLALSDIYYGLDLKPKLVREAVCSKCGLTPCVCAESSPAQGM